MSKKYSHKKANIALIFLVVICISCTNTSDLKTTPTLPVSSLQLANQNVIPSTSPGYQVVYQDEEFTVREMFLGNVVDWKWENFVMPPARIADTTHKVQPGKEMTCDFNNQDQYPCKESIELPGKDGSRNTFTLESEYQLGDGNFILKKNQRMIWIGHMNGGVDLPVRSFASSKENEIALEYTDSNYDGVNPNFWRADYILMTNGYNVSIIDSAFAPNAVFAPNFVNNDLVYFKQESKKISLVYKGKEIGDEYDSVFNQSCCWDGPPVQIYGNGKMIDFFVIKNNGWYHVQAGYQN